MTETQPCTHTSACTRLQLARNVPVYIGSSHKKLKNSVFSKYRNALQHEKINRETYVSYNLQKLDRLRDDEPDWLEYYSAELSENVPEAVATVVATPE